MRVALVAVLVAGTATITAVDRNKDRISADVLTLGPATWVSDSAFMDVQDILVDDTGIWVLSGDEDFLSRMSLDGTVVSSMGAMGDGPNELNRPWVLFDGADGPTVIDPIEWRAVSAASGGSLHASDWEVRGSAPVRELLRHISHQDPFQVRSWGSAFMLARYDSPGRFPSDLAYGSLIRVDAGGATDGYRVELSDGSHQKAPFLAPLTLWDVCDGSLVTASPSGQITWEDRDGTRVVVEAEPDRQRVSRDVAARFLREVASLESRGQATDSVVELAVQDALAVRPRLVVRDAPPFTALACGSGSIWLNRFDAAGDHLGRGDQWMSVTGAGDIADIVTPRGFRPLKAFGDHMYGTVTGPNGFQFIVSIAVPQLGTYPGASSPLRRSDT